jgi:hypothetical protein
MGQLTNYTEKKVLDHVLKTASYSPPATVYLGLSTANPLHDGSGWANPTYTGYARKALTFAAAGSRAIVQTGAVTFDQCTAGSSTVTHWGIWDQLSGGNLMAYGALAVAKGIVAGNTPSVASGQAQVSFSAGVVFTAFINSVLDWLFRAQALSQPTHVKIGLSTSTPADDGTNITEPSGNNYSQQNFDTWNAAADQGSTTVNGDSNSGQAVLNVASTTNFVVGNRVLIGDGTARFEVGVIASIQAGVSLTLVSNLTNTHTAVQGDAVIAPETAQNNGTLGMPTPSGSWGLITYTVLYLDTTKAFYGTVPNQTPDNGDTVEWLDKQYSASIQ